MSKNICYVCQKPKATLHCGICKEDLCKNCAQFTEPSEFSLLSPVPENLTHGTYCNPCFDAHVSEELSVYQDVVARAKEIHVFEKDQGKETRFFKRNEKPLKVENCADRDEALMKLAYMAAKGGFNTLVDVNVTPEKHHSGGTYQTHIWKGSGVPTTVDEARLNRKSRLKNPSR